MTKFRITAPVADFTGLSAGVNFTHGVAEGDAPGDDVQHRDTRRLAYFRGAGYGVEEIDHSTDTQEDLESVEPPAFPGKSASKVDLVAYVLATNPKLDRAEVDKLTRDQLAAQYGPKGEDQ